MTSYVALLRAVNVGGTGKMPSADLKRLGEEAGFGDVRTYIATGNLLFESGLDEKSVKAAIEERVASYAGRRIPVLVRTGEEMADAVRRNPFKDAPPARTVVIFLDEPPPRDTLASISNREDEQIALGRRELYVAYGAAGIGRSKLRIPAAAKGTARNMNTVAKLAELAATH